MEEEEAGEVVAAVVVAEEEEDAGVAVEEVIKYNLLFNLLIYKFNTPIIL